ncbi:hypothetical protein K469DRAFT_556288 [Zopfia rhizophila CBS 207.26]|uniref:Rhodopsin domain-containing protein n=1 Tax=Zopfia rhizophila CBS 207.26 TaxID=1314779 RepID=A0A6A6EKW7_9PEZI|nr:hypothetical protein K469DRAFT_556288 [Zopfia rhizophila CBS 207.26]
MAIENRGPELQAACATFVSMAFVATMMRIYVRLRLVRAFGWDDWFMVAAMLTHIMFATCSISGVHYGTGRHMWDLTSEGIFKALRYWWLCYVAYCSTMIFSKISIGLFLLRVTPNKIHRWIIYTVMGLTVITGIVFFFVTLLQCTPINYFWDKTIKGGRCINIDVIIGLTFLYSAFSAICDFTFGILPIFLVWNLNMSRNSKIALVPILSMACVASTAVIVRCAYVMDFKSNDFLYRTTDIAIWSDIEQGLAITAGSLATLRPLYRLIAERLGFTQTGTPMPASGKATPHKKRSTFSEGNNSRGKRSGPFSLITLTKHDNKSDEEYGLGSVKPIPLPDEGSEDGNHERGEKTFSTWRIQVGENSSQEELHKKGGITRKTEVNWDSESVIRKD